VSKPIDPKLLLDAINRWSGETGAAAPKAADDTVDEYQERSAKG
jgi:hypothetical protein